MDKSIVRIRSFFNWVYRLLYKRVTYDEIYSKFDNSITWKLLCKEVFGEYLGQYSFTSTNQIHFLIEQLGITSRSSVLDIGSGLGGLSCYMSRVSGCQITGLEASKVAVKIANEKAVSVGLQKRVWFKVCILPDIPFTMESFDAIIGIESIYAIPDKDRLFKECYRTLKPKGYIGFYATFERKKLLPSNMQHRRLLKWYNARSYESFLEDAGFENISRIDLTGEFLQISRRWVEAIENNRRALERELGKRYLEEVLNNIKPFWMESENGFIGRALYKAQKPR